MDRVLVSRFTYRFRDPRRGDIAAFHAPDAAAAACGLVSDADVVYIKRVIALPASVGASSDGFIYIDGKRLNEPYIKPDRRDHGDDSRAR